ncbi:MAG TPA: alternative ribosome rescue aminoacyl-tRNA hydrolase ArfB [Alphaproteobacteria bacterium]|nr:alternative ribosome rescue aminoacyl-tRNA hydrolase ArfB [Alphaproteobacteria bacterium]
MIPITDRIAIDESELDFEFVLASGPGGQNVNKVSSAVRLKFDIRRSPSIPDAVRSRLERLAGRRLTQDGILVIAAQRFRSQIRNREDAIERLAELIRAASIPPKPRRPTRPTLSSRRERLQSKARRSAVKQTRGRVRDD